MEEPLALIPMDEGWQFFSRQTRPLTNRETVTLPHCVSKLSWQQWEPSTWEDLWLYRNTFIAPTLSEGHRIFVCFERAMVTCTVQLNGATIGQHQGGFVPFEFELTNHLRDGSNILEVTVDARQLNVPPTGLPGSKPEIDYMLPGGLIGGVTLQVRRAVFLKNLFAKPVDVMNEHCRLDISCDVDAVRAEVIAGPVVATLLDGARTVARAETQLVSGQRSVQFSLLKLPQMQLWHVDRPKLYDLEVRTGDQVLRTRIGFREAKFTDDGFFLNGERLTLFGLNRHELFPYVGFAMPPRVQRKDAEILKHTLNCNMVRCSHYPQSPAFLDACDELGLLVWEEIPGWQYLGDATWKALALRDVEAMITRDRNHAAIVVWGVRVNESANDPELYRKTYALAKQLDDSRATSGSMTPSSRKDWKEHWHQDVFAYDDYATRKPGTVEILPPLTGVPYMLAETVGQFDYRRGKYFDAKYRRNNEDADLLMEQPLRHAQAFQEALNYPRMAGAIAWCAFDYSSRVNAWHNVKTPGVCDGFRIPKLGAAFYQSQCDPKKKAVVEPGFYWDFGPHTPHGPGEQAAIYSNCERLEIFVGGAHHASLQPDLERFSNLYPPFFADLRVDGNRKPELRIDGYVGGRLAVSRQWSSDTTKDRFVMNADDASIACDGVDATRVTFGVVDAFGAPRPYATGAVTFTLEGPGVLIGDSPFLLDEAGGVGAVWVRSMPNQCGSITLRAQHALGVVAAAIAST